MASHSPIFRKLLATSFLVIGLTFLGVDFYLTRFATQKVQEHIAERLEYEARVMAREVEGLPVSKLEAWAQATAPVARARITVIDGKGAVLADSQHDPETMENHATRPEIRSAMDTGMGSSIRHSATLNLDFLYLAIGVHAGNDVGSVLRLAVPLEAINAEIIPIHWRILEASLVAMVAAFGLAFFFSRYLTLRIERLRLLAQKLSEARPLEESRPLQEDELGGLERSLHRTSHQISGLVERLKLESAQRSAILTGMVEGVLAVDSDLHITFCNESFARAMNTAYPIPDQLPLVDLVREPDLIDALKRVMAGGPIEQQLLQLSVGDERIYCAAQVMPLSMPSGAGALALLQDITQRKLAEDALQREKAFSEAIMGSLPGAFFVIDDEGRLIRWNKAAESVGYSAQQLMGMEAHSVVAPEERSHIRARWQQAFAEGSSMAEAHIVTTDGRTIPYLFTAERAVIGSKVYVIGTGIDITERKQMMEALSQSEQRYKEFISHTADGVWRFEFKQPIPADLPEDEVLEMMRRHGYLAECNDALARILGAPSAAGLVGARFDDLIPQSESLWVERVHSLIQSGFKTRTIEFQYIDRLGKPRDVQRTDIPIVERGMLKRWWGISRDITERKQASEALRQSELRFRGLVENSPLPMLITTPPPEEKILLMNRRFTELFGYTVAEVRDVNGWWPRAYPDAAEREEIRLEWEERIAAAQAAGRSAIEPMEVEITCQDGTPRQVEVHLTLDGGGTLVIFNDLTDRKKAEKAVRESEELFRQMAVNSPYAFILWDVRAERHIYINPAYETIWGQTPESLYADVDGWKKAVHPDDRARMSRLVRGDFQANPERSGIEDEFRIVRPDGAVRWVHMNRFPVRGDAGDVYRIGCVAQDITDRKEAAEALQKEKAFTEAVIDSLPGVFYVVDAAGRLVRWNQNAKILGYSPEELAGMGPHGTIALEDRALVSAKQQEALEQGTVIAEAHLLAKDGRKIPYFFTGVRATIGDSLYIVGTGIDITERKRAEAALQREKAFSETVIDSLPGLFYIVDQRGEIIRWNKNTEKILGYSKEELDAIQTFEVIAEEDRDLLAAKWQKAFAEGTAGAEARLLTKQGRKVPFLFTALRAVIDDKVYVVGTGIDIGERKEAEEALQEEKAFSDAVIDSLPGAFFVTDRTGRMVRWNRNSETLLGYSSEELAALGPQGTIAVEEREFTAAKRQEVFAEGSAMTEVNLLAKDGTKIPCLLRGMRVVLGEDTYVVGMAIDITERKRGEEALRQRELDLEEAQRLAQVGSWVWDVKSDSVVWSKELYRISGRDPKLSAPNYSRDFQNRYTPETWKRLAAAVESTMQTGAPFELEMEINRPETGQKWVIARGEAVRNAEGGTRQIRGTVQDITEHKRAEEALRVSDQRYRDFISHTQDGVWRVELERPIPTDVSVDEASEMLLRYGVFAECNDAMARISGFTSAKDLVGKNIGDLISRDDVERMESIRASCQGGWISRTVELQAIDRAGIPKTLLRTEVPIIEKGKVVRIWGITRDITGIQQTQEALRRSEASLAEAQRIAHFANWEWDVLTNEEHWSDEMYRLVGLEPGKVKPTFELFVSFVHPDEVQSLVRIAKETQETGKSLKIDFRVIRADGEIRYLQSYAEVIRDDAGKAIRLVGTTQDFTERKQAEDALRASESSLAKAQRIAHVGSWEWDILTNEERWSEEMYRLMGLEPGKVRPNLDMFMGFVHPEDREGLIREGERAQEGEKVLQHEYRIIRADGMVRHLQMHAEVVRDEAGKPIRMVGTTQDLTDRKRAEESVRISEARYRALIEGAPEAIVVVDMDSGKFVDFNENAMHLFGLSEKELLKVGPVEVSPPFQPDGRSSAEAAAEVLQIAKAKNNPVFEWVHRNANGQEIPCEVRLARLPSAGGTLVRGSISDISDRKRAEEERSRLASIVKSSGDAIVGITPDGLVSDWNAAAERVYGFSAEELIGRPVSVIALPGGENAIPAFLEKIKQEERITDFEAVNLRKNGERFPASLTMFAVRDRQGKVLGFSGIIRDITERKRAEIALRTSEERYRLLFERSLAGVVRTSMGGAILECNEAWARIYGFASREEALGTSVKNLYFDENDRVLLLDPLKQQKMVIGQEIHSRRKDGTPAWVLLSASLIENESEGSTILATVFDITQWKELGEQLRQAQKMEAVGRLAGGVAHDFNNMLQIINGYSELVLDQLQPKDALHGHVQEIKSVVERAANLTRQLLAFSRQQVLAPQVLDLNVAIGHLSKMLRRLIGEDVELKIIDGKGLGRVKTDPGQIDQVILNLAVNARDAMPKGGKLTIETSNVVVDKAFALSHFPMTPGPYVMISVSDNGQGMDSGTQARIFEPFFTTKKNQGTGLGLATVYGIIKQSGGFIWVESEIGEGTTFKIYLPPVKQAATARDVKAAPTLAGGTETVLLVEDDETIRTLVRRGLQARGYRVLEARNGREAMRIAEKHQGPIHLLMTDVVMPGMGGRELAERLTRSRGEMKTLYMSGYADDALLHHGALTPGTALLQKPFTTDQMARTVRKVLKKG